MTRWSLGRKSPKHLQKIGDETVLERIVRQLTRAEPDAEIYITSHDDRYEIPGAVRHEPQNNRMEIDRFTWELIREDTCFLYGDTYYADEAIETISRTDGKDLLFFSAGRSIVAVHVFNERMMKEQVEKVREDYLSGRLAECKGWQLYYSVVSGGADAEACMIRLGDRTQGFNTVEEYEALLKTLPCGGK